MLNMGAGYVAKVPAPEGGEGFINAKIVEKYPHFALVKTGETKWCVRWDDIMRLNAK